MPLLKCISLLMLLLIVVMSLFKLQGVIVEKFKKATPLILNSLLEGVKDRHINMNTNIHFPLVFELLTLIICITIFTVIVAFVVKFLVDIILD